MITNIFSTPVWNLKLDIPSDLIQRIKNLMETDPQGRVYSNVGGWQSNDIGNNPDFKDICLSLCKLLPEVYTEIYPNGKQKPALNSIWINVSKGSNTNIPHIHPQSHISGCFYIKCNKNSGAISFKNPTFELVQHYGYHEESLNNNLFQHKVDYQPTEGDVILFPSWIFHEVLPSRDDEERITIAFNTTTMD